MQAPGHRGRTRVINNELKDFYLVASVKPEYAMVCLTRWPVGGRNAPPVAAESSPSLVRRLVMILELCSVSQA